MGKALMSIGAATYAPDQCSTWWHIAYTINWVTSIVIDNAIRELFCGMDGGLTRDSVPPERCARRVRTGPLKLLIEAAVTL